MFVGSIETNGIGCILLLLSPVKEESSLTQTRLLGVGKIHKRRSETVNTNGETQVVIWCAALSISSGVVVKTLHPGA